MKEMLNSAKNSAGELVASSVDKATQLAQKARPAAGTLQRAADFLVDTAGRTADEIGRLGKDAIRTDLAKDAAAGAAIGAVVAVPVPLVGPVAGAVVGAGLGVYKNIRNGARTGDNDSPQAQPQAQTPTPEPAPTSSSDKFKELEKLHDLKVKGILTDEEFTSEKKKILDR